MVERKFETPDKGSTRTPYSVLLLDRQYYLSAGGCFVRHVRQIHEQDAARKLSQINIPFAPHRESINIHWVRIWRGGQAIEQVKSSDELEVRAASQPNRLVVHLELDDLRLGDTLDIAYSTKAHKPRRRFSASHPIRQRVPILEWHLSAIAPKDCPLESKCHQGELQSAVRQLSEGSHFHHWSLAEVAELDRVANTPSWHQPNPELQLSNFGSWPKVATEIYHRWQVQPPGDAEEAVARSLAQPSDADAWEPARRACRFVQDEIANTPARALSAEPATPSAETLDTRRGDSRAKACLLVNLLRTLGIPAASVLVSNQRKRSIANALPAADLFDHVIVRGRIEDVDFWIDPCAEHQAGPIQPVALPPYHLGLQVSPRTKNLCAVPKPDQQADRLTVTEHFVVDQKHRAVLKTTVRASGSDASSVRARLAGEGAEGFAESRLAELQNRHPGAGRSGRLSLEDDTEKNEIVIREKFEIPELFTGNGDTAIFRPPSISKCLPAPADASTTREHPLALNYPCNIRHMIVIDTPWNVEEGETSENLPGTAFAFSFKGTTEGKRHTLRYAYNALDDHIVPVDMRSAQMRLETLRPLLAYVFQCPVPSSSANGKSGRGKRIEPENKKSAQRERKNGPPGGTVLKPLIGVAAAIALFLFVRANFREKAGESAKAIIEEKVAKRAAEEAAAPEEPPAPPVIELPENPLDYAPKPAGPDRFDAVKFDIGEGTTGGSEKTSKPTRGDWKLTK